MFPQIKIERQKLIFLLLLITAWTTFGLFFGTQNYIRDTYAGRSVSLSGYIISWIFCGYSWGLLTIPVVHFVRRFSLLSLGWTKFFAVHIPSSLIFSSIQLGIYLLIAGVLFHTANRGLIDFYKLLIANELQSSILVYCALVAVITVKDTVFRRKAIFPLPDEAGKGNADEEFVATSGQTDGFLRRISVKDNGRIILIDTARISRIESYGNYLFLHTPERKLIYRETMTAMERRLDPAEFVRIRRSAIVKVDQIRELLPIENGEYEIVMTDGEVLFSTRRYRKNLESILHP